MNLSRAALDKLLSSDSLKREGISGAEVEGMCKESALSEINNMVM